VVPRRGLSFRVGNGHLCGSLVPVPARLGRAESRRRSRVPGRRFGGCDGSTERDAKPLCLAASPRLVMVQTMLPGRKFQSNPGVPPARLIETDVKGLWAVDLPLCVPRISVTRRCQMEAELVYSERQR
jgi:hypothetical protein